MGRALPRSTEALLALLERHAREGLASEEELERFLRLVLEEGALESYMQRIAERLFAEHLRYCLEHAKEFDEAMSFLLSLEPGRYYDEQVIDRVIQLVYNVIRPWLDHFDSLADLVGKKVFDPYWGYVLPDGTRFRLIKSGSYGLRIVLGKLDAHRSKEVLRKSIFIDMRYNPLIGGAGYVMEIEGNWVYHIEREMYPEPQTT